MRITWARRVIPKTGPSYEVSSKGDARFSAFNAIMPDQRELYSCVIANGGVLTDCFASTPINQAHALSVILNDLCETGGHPPWLQTV